MRLFVFKFKKVFFPHLFIIATVLPFEHAYSNSQSCIKFYNISGPSKIEILNRLLSPSESLVSFSVVPFPKKSSDLNFPHFENDFLVEKIIRYQGARLLDKDLTTAALHRVENLLSFLDDPNGVENFRKDFAITLTPEKKPGQKYYSPGGWAHIHIEIVRNNHAEAVGLALRSQHLSENQLLEVKPQIQSFLREYGLDKVILAVLDNQYTYTGKEVGIKIPFRTTTKSKSDQSEATVYLHRKHTDPGSVEFSTPLRVTSRNAEHVIRPVAFDLNRPDRELLKDPALVDWLASLELELVPQSAERRFRYHESSDYVVADPLGTLMLRSRIDPTQTVEIRASVLLNLMREPIMTLKAFREFVKFEKNVSPPGKSGFYVDDQNLLSYVALVSEFASQILPQANRPNTFFVLSESTVNPHDEDQKSIKKKFASTNSVFTYVRLGKISKDTLESYGLSF